MDSVSANARMNWVNSPVRLMTSSSLVLLLLCSVPLTLSTWEDDEDHATVHPDAETGGGYSFETCFRITCSDRLIN